MDQEAELRVEDGEGDEPVAVTPLELIAFIRHAAS